MLPLPSAGEARGLTRFFSFVSLAFLVPLFLGTPPVAADEIADRIEALRAANQEAELAIVRAVEASLTEAALAKLGTSGYWQRLDGAEAALSVLVTDGARGRIRELGRRHRDPNVRRMTLAVVERHLPDAAAEELILDLIHDPDDLVAFAGIRLAGKHRIVAGMQDLLDIVGVASGTIHSPGKPVGVGAALGNRAVMQVLGSQSYREIFRRERLWHEHGVLASPTGEAETPLPAPYPSPRHDYFPGRWEQQQLDWARRLRSHLPPSAVDIEGGPPRGRVEPDERGIPMVEVPAGPFQFGVAESRLPSRRFVTHDYVEPRQMRLEAFLIDVFPVTNEHYDQFVAAVERDGHRWCHPDEKPDKVHRRNTWRDPRMKSDHPVAGVDWYDGWAFCNWLGKQLPSEHQWEKAARGSDGRLYPWGNVWDPRRVTYAETIWGYGLPTVDIWRAHLFDVVDRPRPYPASLTQPVDAHPGNVSPYGVRELIGNAWEWTRTNYFSQQDMDPHFQGRDFVDFTHDPAAFATIRGGAWSSIPELLSGAYRSKDLFTDRHNEIGFRCARDLP